uniref:(northern house mosquito) hypothetical protein n=1 Tax=Culex pipiens TaxID=7175 RepID=A0A8D8I9Q7_CULPI
MCVCAYKNFHFLFPSLSLHSSSFSRASRAFPAYCTFPSSFLLLFPSPALLSSPPPHDLALVHPLIAKRRVACRLLPAPARNSSPRSDRPTLSLTSTAFLLFRFLTASGPIRSATAERLRDVRMNERPGRSVLARTLACPTRSLAKHFPDRSRRECPFLMTPRGSAILLFFVLRGLSGFRSLQIKGPFWGLFPGGGVGRDR